ncbi:MAG TPA: FtsX-like permease family protein [Steroidobacteraceae bacterium]|nr:FtsX-like permease family protein [Steroidobacteraceae bacterium]
MLRFLPLTLANLRRRPLRTLFTLSSITVAFLLFGLLAAVRNGFEANVGLAGAGRLVTMNKTSIVQPLPVSYRARIEQVPGVTLVTHSTWFGGRYQDDRNVLIMYPVEAQNYLAMYPEYRLPPSERASWLRDRRGVIVGRSLARAYGWKVGDHIPIRSEIYRHADGSDTWDFIVDGIYDNENPSGDVSSVFFHYEYFDEGRVTDKGTVGWYIVRIADPERAAPIAQAIDATFSNSAAETKTGTEQAFVQSFARQTGDIGAIVVAIGVAVFFTMLLVSANTMAQSVRERTRELAVLKTLGFANATILTLVLAEAMLITVSGGTFGLLLGAAVVARTGDTLREFISAFLITPGAVALGVALMLILGLAAGAIPAARAVRLQIAEALGRH